MCKVALGQLLSLGMNEVDEFFFFCVCTRVDWKSKQRGQRGGAEGRGQVILQMRSNM